MAEPIEPAMGKDDVIHFSRNQPNHPFYSHYTGQPAFAGTSILELEDFVGAKFYCPHALADGKQHIWIKEKTLEFSTVLSTLSTNLAVSVPLKRKYITCCNDDRGGLSHGHM